MADLVLSLSDSITPVETLAFNGNFHLTDNSISVESLVFSGDVLGLLEPVNKNFNIMIGEDFSYSFAVKTVHGDFLNLTGCSVSTKYSNTFNYTTSNILTSAVSNNIAGIVTISMTNAQSSVLKEDRYVYSTFLITPTGKHIKIMGGMLILTNNLI